MVPRTKEGIILRDADKLDFIYLPRWIESFAENYMKHAEAVIDLLPRLREEILSMDISRELYDAKLPLFVYFVERFYDSLSTFITVSACDKLVDFIVGAEV